jgi:hypothetical protein
MFLSTWLIDVPEDFSQPLFRFAILLNEVRNLRASPC